MPTDTTEDTRTCVVPVGREAQYALWLADRVIRSPRSREACLACVGKGWTDTTPKRLRKQTHEARSTR